MKLSRKYDRFFYTWCIYYPVSQLKGAKTMRESNDYEVDLDDLIFDEDDGLPSSR